jgi:AAA domain/Bifunctional DNA primase/polymerase, N-terminal
MIEINEGGKASWEFLDEAKACRLRLLAGGYVPIPLRGKVPAHTSWQNVNPPDEDEVRSWSSVCATAYNTGILCHSVPALDIDVLDPDVADQLEDMAATLVGDHAPVLVRFGKRPKRAVLFQTDVPFKKVKTPVFTSPDGKRHHVEVLGAGQQIVVHGVHPDTHEEYAWTGGSPIDVKREDLPVLTEDGAHRFIADAAAVMTRAGWREEKVVKVTVATPTDGVAHHPPVIGPVGVREKRWAAATLAGCVTDLANAAPGSRNDMLNAISFRMGRIVVRGWIDRNVVVRDLVNAAEACGLGGVETTQTCKSGLKAGMEQPHPDLEDRPVQDQARPVAVAPEPAKVLEEAREDPVVDDEVDTDPLGNFIFAADEAPAPQKMLIEDVLPAEGLTFIGGQSSAGKTFIAVLMAICVATGLPFFGRRVNERVGTVIVAAEGRGALRTRIAAASKELGIEQDLPIAWVKEVPDFNTPEALQKLIKQLRAISEHLKTKFGVRLGLVFFDTVSASFNLQDEASNSEAAQVCKVMRKIGEATGVNMVPIHHYGKNQGVGLRGASAWRANSDCIVSVVGDVDQLTGEVSNQKLAIAKDRDGAQGPLTRFYLKFVQLGIGEDGKPWGSMVPVPLEEEDKSGTKWPEILSVFRKALINALAGQGAGDCRPYPNGPEVRAVAVAAVRREFDQKCIVDSGTEQGKQEAKRKQFVRKLNQAQEKGLIAVHDSGGRQIVWLAKDG